MQFLGRAQQIHAGVVGHADLVAALAVRFGFTTQRGQHRGHRHGFFLGVFLRLQSRQGQQVFHQLGHALGLFAHLFQHRAGAREVLRVHHVQVAVHHGQRRAQFMGHIGDEVAAHLFQPQQLAHVARDQQPVVGRVGNQAQVEADGRIHRRGHVQNRLGIAPAGQPVRQRHRLQALDQGFAEVAGVVQPQQRGRRFVEPLHALAVAVYYHHRIGQRGRGGAVAAQHVQQAAFARAHFHLVAVQHPVQFVPHAGAAGGIPTLARGQATQHGAQPPVVPDQRGNRHQCDAHPDMPGGQPYQHGGQQQNGQGGKGLQPGGADVARHYILWWFTSDVERGLPR